MDDLRHSCAHLLAAAVMELWPKTKRAIGPSIENGFYYDFDFDPSTHSTSSGQANSGGITAEDLPKIEAKMAEILPAWDGFIREEVSADEAKKRFADNPYKLELIDEFSNMGKTLTIYKSGNFEDLCAGGHTPNPAKDIGAFKLTSLAGAYWRGSEKNKMLSRIYGTCFQLKEELDEHLRNLEEAKNRDHRKIGKELGLFVFSDLVGQGLPLLTPKGTIIRMELEKFIVEEELKRGYQYVITPPLAKVQLYETSGHYPYYKNIMYPPMKVDEDELILRPMTCPHHFMLYKSQPRSYRELPIRYAEISPQFRYEKSGELSGLMRVRMFTLSDAHIICTTLQAREEIKGVLELIEYVNRVLGLIKGKDYQFRLSLGDRNNSDKYYKDDQAWDNAELILKEVLEKTKVPYFEAENEAAFYGPKIDIQIKNVLAKEETAFTVQYDFVQPKRFKLSYIDESGLEKEPVVIHRSSIGAFERSMAFLIEHFRGAFPLWLSPIQVIIVPISDKNLKYAQKVFEKLINSNIRVQLDNKAETMQLKIRNATLQKIPFILVVGGKEEKEETVSVRKRGSKDLGVQKLDEFISEIKINIESKTIA